MKTYLIVGLFLALALAGCNLPPTATPLPPTNTPVPPTATSAPPTATSVPPTATPFVFGEPVMGWVPGQFRMLNASDGWGADGRHLLRTTDGGSVWEEVTPPQVALTDTSLNLGYLSPQALWVMIPSYDNLDQGRLLRTLDGGATWQELQTPFGSASLQVVNQNQLFALADYGGAAGSAAVALFTSLDGGVSWTLVADARPDNSIPDTLSFSGQKTGLAAADGLHIFVTGEIPMDGFTYVYASADGGTTFVQQSLPLPDPYTGAMTVFYPPQFFSLTQGGMFAQLYTAGQTYLGLYTTADSGQTWSFGGAMIMMGGAACMSDPLHAFIYDGITFATSQDGGATWNQLNTDLPIGGYPMDIQFLDAQNGWMVVDSGGGAYQIYRTLDGGHTWHLLAEAVG